MCTDLRLVQLLHLHVSAHPPDVTPEPGSRVLVAPAGLRVSPGDVMPSSRSVGATMPAAHQCTALGTPGPATERQALPLPAA